MDHPEQALMAMPTDGGGGSQSEITDCPESRDVWKDGGGRGRRWGGRRRRRALDLGG